MLASSFSAWLWSTVPFFLIFSILVYVHELGHYWVAKKNGIRVEVFSVGFGPKLFRWVNSSGTIWKVSIFPLGGYVKMLSDSQSSIPVNSEQEKGGHRMTEVSLSHKPVAIRIAVSMAGPLANYGLAVLILCFLYTCAGRPIPTDLVEVGGVLYGSPAADAGVRTGDVICSVGGVETPKLEQFQLAMKLNYQHLFSVCVERGGRQSTLILHLKEMDTGEESLGNLGIELKMHSVQLPFYQAFYHAVLESIRFSYNTLKSMGHMISHSQLVAGMSGPIGIAALTSKVAKGSLEDLLCFTALLSANLGLINLLPIPTLDGGHVLFYLVEAAYGRPLPGAVQRLGYRLGFAFILIVILIATWNDLANLDVLRRLLRFFQD